MFRNASEGNFPYKNPAQTSLSQRLRPLFPSGKIKFAVEFDEARRPGLDNLQTRNRFARNPAPVPSLNNHSRGIHDLFDLLPTTPQLSTPQNSSCAAFNGTAQRAVSNSDQITAYITLSSK
jgi:hypothetical protein